MAGVALHGGWLLGLWLVSARLEEEEEDFITSGNWRGKHNSLSRGAGADQESRIAKYFILIGDTN